MEFKWLIWKVQLFFSNEEIHYCNIDNAHIIFEPARKQQYERQT